MHATWALALAGLLSTIVAAGDHHATNVPRPAQAPTPMQLPVPPRFTNIDWAVGIPEGPYGCNDYDNCNFRLQSLLRDPKTALMKAELKKLTNESVQRFSTGVLHNYLRDHGTYYDCVLFSNDTGPPLSPNHGPWKREVNDEIQRATEDLLRALEVIQSPESQKMIRQQIKLVAATKTMK